MAVDERRATLPPNVVALYTLAKEAFLYHERQERKWDVPSLLAFRDALDDLVKASKANDDSEAHGYVATASEHLSMIIAEALQRATEERLLVVDELLRPSLWRRTFLQPYTENTPAKVQEQKDQIGYYLDQGRGKKASINPTEAEDCFESFKSAHGIAITLERDIRLEEQSLQLRLPVAGIVLFATLVAGGLISFAITQLLS